MRATKTLEMRMRGEARIRSSDGLGANMKTKITMQQARLNALKVMDEAENRREKIRQYESRCSFCHGGPHTLGECPACGLGDTAEKEIQRLNGIIRRASVRFFNDGSDGETAAAMLKILDEAKAPNTVLDHNPAKP